MARLIDVSHVVEDGLVTYPGLPAPIVCDYLSREASRAAYAEGTTFQIGKIEMVANTGTYVDSPFHRYEDGADLAALDLASLADLEGIVLDATAIMGRAIDASFLEGLELAGKAVLIRTGWDRHWNTPAYFSGHPFLTGAAGRVPARRGGAARRDRLAEHRRHGGWGTPGPHDPAGRGDPDCGAPVRPVRAARERVPLPRRAGEVPRRGDLSGARLWGSAIMADPQVSRLSKDLLLKHVVGGLRGDFLSRFGLPYAPILMPLPTDLPMLEVRGRQTDLLFRLADGNILHVEFQMRNKPADLFRFCNYNLAVAEQYFPSLVFTLVLHGPESSGARDSLDTGSNIFSMRNVLLGKEDGEAVLGRLKEKRARGESLDARDRLDLILLPLMGRHRSIEAMLTDVADVAGSLPRAEQEQTVGALVGLSYHYVDEAFSVALLEALKMTNALQSLLEDTVARGIEQGVAQGIEQGVARGIEQGVARGKAEEARRLLRLTIAQRFGAIPAALERRIELADLGTLDRMFERSLNASSIEAIEQV